MALTQAHKLALRDWLQANVHKAVRTYYSRRGVKDANGKPVYGECTRYEPHTNVPVLDEEGNPVTYWGRTFTLEAVNQMDWREIVRRVWRKAVKNGYDVTPEQVRDFLEPYQDNIKAWALCERFGNADITDAEIDAEDPDA